MWACQVVLLDTTPGGCAIRGIWGGLVLPRAEEEKNGHNSASVVVWDSYITDISNGYIGLQNFFLPYNKKKKKIKNQIMNGGIKSPPIH